MKKILFTVFSIFVLQGCLLERAAPLTPITPYLVLWGKPNMNIQSRRLDSIECSGGEYSGENYPYPSYERHAPYFSRNQIEKNRQPEDINDIATEFRMRIKWQRCMLKKGYQYVGTDCYGYGNGEISPACEGHQLQRVPPYQ